MDGDSNDAPKLLPPHVEASSAKPKAPRTAFDSERAKAAGKASAEARKAKRDNPPEPEDTMSRLERKALARLERLIDDGGDTAAVQASREALNMAAEIRAKGRALGECPVCARAASAGGGLAAFIEALGEEGAKLTPEQESRVGYLQARGVADSEIVAWLATDYSRLTNAEMGAFRDLVRKSRGEDVANPEAAILARQTHEYQRLEPPYIDLHGRLVGIVPGCLPLPTEPSTPDPTSALKREMDAAPSSTPMPPANAAPVPPRRAPEPLPTTRPPGTAMRDLEWDDMPGQNRGGNGRIW